MSQLPEMLFTQTWWSWNPQDDQWLSLAYHWFNIFEGAAWASSSRDVAVVSRGEGLLIGRRKSFGERLGV